jgi:hypothetical protein
VWAGSDSSVDAFGRQVLLALLELREMQLRGDDFGQFFRLVLVLGESQVLGQGHKCLQKKRKQKKGGKKKQETITCGLVAWPDTPWDMDMKVVGFHFPHSLRHF